MPNFGEMAKKMSPKGWVMLGGSLVLGVAFLMIVMSVASKPSYSTLEAGIDPAQTGKITSTLSGAGISYQLQNNGTAIGVDSSQMAQARVARAVESHSQHAGVVAQEDRGGAADHHAAARLALDAQQLLGLQAEVLARKAGAGQHDLKARAAGGPAAHYPLEPAGGVRFDRGGLLGLDPQLLGDLDRDRPVEERHAELPGERRTDDIPARPVGG